MDERLKVEVFADATDVRLSVGIREGSVAFELIFGGWGRRIEDASRRRCNACGVDLQDDVVLWIVRGFRRRRLRPATGFRRVLETAVRFGMLGRSNGSDLTPPAQRVVSADPARTTCGCF